MTFTLCRNGCCDRAGWCKRITYPVTPDREPERVFFDCSPDNRYAFYVRNKAREIYERDYPNESFSLKDDKSDSQENENNNREPGMREDNETDPTTEQSVSEGSALGPGRLLQFQCSGDRRSDIESDPLLTEFYDSIARQLREEGFTILPDITLYGVPSTRLGDGQPDD